MRVLTTALAMGFCTTFGLSSVRANEPHEITQLSVIPIANGVNEVSDFTTDGRRAMIVEGWRDNGNAHGYRLFLVTLESQSDGRDRWDVVTVQTKNVDRQLDVIDDSPFTVEEAVSSVRFAHGRVDGRPATLLITATRDLNHAASFSDPAPVDIEFYRLVQNDLPGWPPDYFDLVETIRPRTAYCNSDLALTKEIGLPLPDPYAGPNRDDGCLH